MGLLERRELWVEAEEGNKELPSSSCGMRSTWLVRLERPEDILSGCRQASKEARE